MVRVSRDAEDLLAGPTLPEADLSLRVGRDEQVAAGCEGEVVYLLDGLAEVKRFSAAERVPETNPLPTGGGNETTVRGEGERSHLVEDFSLLLHGLMDRLARGGVPKVQPLVASRGQAAPAR